MDCVTDLHAGVAGSSATEKEQKFVPFSFYYNPPPPITMKFKMVTDHKPLANMTLRARTDEELNDI